MPENKRGGPLSNDRIVASWQDRQMHRRKRSEQHSVYRMVSEESSAKITLFHEMIRRKVIATYKDITCTCFYIVWCVNVFVCWNESRLNSLSHVFSAIHVRAYVGYFLGAIHHLRSRITAIWSSPQVVQSLGKHRTWLSWEVQQQLCLGGKCQGYFTHES